ncbi:MAG: hypothetical protein ACE366_05575 [Bradymonadia bacterium]
MMMSTEFNGRSTHDAKRRALNYWYMNRDGLGLSLSQFFSRCRVRTARGLTTITYYPEDQAQFRH